MVNLFPANKTISELQADYSKTSQSNDVASYLSFCKKLISSNELDCLSFHYALLKDRSIDDRLYQMLRRSFSDHGHAGEAFLLEKIATESDPSLRGDVLQILGTMKYSGGKLLAETAAWARKLIKNDVDTLRCRAIWVLGWLGMTNDIDRILADRLFNDPNHENRGWAATAMMQIFFSDKTTAEKSLSHLKQAIRVEKDYFTLEMILVAIQELTGKRLGLKSGSRKRAPKDKVDAALKKALLLR